MCMHARDIITAITSTINRLLLANVSLNEGIQVEHQLLITLCNVGT